MATIRLRMFASAREAAGTASAPFEAETVGEVLDAAVTAYGESFEAVLGQCRVWRNGDPAEREHAVTDGDEIAVLPPVSGGF